MEKPRGRREENWKLRVKRKRREEQRTKRKAKKRMLEIDWWVKEAGMQREVGAGRK